MGSGPRISGIIGKKPESRIPKLAFGAFLVVALFIIAGPGYSQSDLPGWLIDPTSEYPPREFLVGMGSGESEEVAVEHARAELAAGFRASVQSEMQVEDDVAETFGKGDSTFDRTTRNRRTTQVNAQENLANMTLARTWHDVDSGRHHALVVIKRDEYQRILEADIRNYLSKMNALVNCDDCYPNPLSEYRGSIQAVYLFQDYAGMSAQLRVVSEGRLGEVEESLGSQIAAWFAETGSRMTLVIEGSSPKLSPILRDVLMEVGFKVLESNALFSADLRYETSPAPKSDYFIFEKWQISLRIRNTDDGSDVVTLNKHDRAGHKSREGAQERCFLEAKETLEGEFQSELRDFLTGNPSSDRSQNP